VTVVERFVLERQIQNLSRQLSEERKGTEESEIAIGQRVYYRGRFLGKVRI
jgi:hypothetical protein